MKIRIIAVAAALLLLLTLNVSAASYEYTISPGTDFTSVQYGDDLSDISQKLNMTTDELNSYFSKNGLLYLAVSDDTKTQIRLSAFTDNFSSAVGDISQLDQEALAEFVNAVSDDGDNTADIITNGDRKYICTKNTLKDSGGTYTVTQYITICSNKTFYFAGYNPGEDTSDEVTEMFKSFQLQETTAKPQVTIEQKEKLTRQSFFINCGVVLFGIVAIISIIGIIKLKLKSNKETGENEN